MFEIKKYLKSKGYTDEVLKPCGAILHNFLRINWLLSIYYNFKILPINQAYKLPIIIGRNVVINSIGKIHFTKQITPGMVLLNIIRISELDSRNEALVFSNKGTFFIGGRCKVHPGAKISIGKNAIMEWGERVSVGSNTKIACHDNIVIGHDSRISWNSQVFDTDFHFLHSITKDKYYPRKKPVKIGSNVFIGNSCTIGKGTIIPDGSVVSCCSKVSGDFSKEGNNLLIAGNPSKILAKGFEMGSGWFPEKEKDIAKNFEE